MKLKYYLWSVLTFVALCLATGCDDDDTVSPVPGEKPEPEVVYPKIIVEYTSIEAAAEGGGCGVKFFVEDALPDQKLHAASDAEWISNLSSDATPGKITFTVAQNTAGKRRASIVLSYKNAKDVVVEVNQLAGEVDQEPDPRPDPQKAPELTLNADYNAQIKALVVDMVCLSKNAQEASLACLPADMLKQVLGEGKMTLDDILDPANNQATALDAKLLGILNGEGFKQEPIVAWNAQLAGMNLAVLLKAANPNGATIVRSDAQMEQGEANPDPDSSMQTGNGPELRFEGLDDGTMIIFFAQSASKDVADGEIIISTKSQFDTIFARSHNDLEAVAKVVHGQGQPIVSEWLEFINGEGLQLSLTDVDHSISYAALIAVNNAKNQRTIAYTVAKSNAEPEPEPTPQTGNLDVGFKVDASSDMFSLMAICHSKNAEKAWVAWLDPTKVKADLNGGATLESVMDAAMKDTNVCEEFDRAWVKEMNGKGCGLTMGATPGLSVAFLLNVTNKDGRVVKHVDATAPEAYEGESYVKALTDADFCNLVWDYNADADFRFKGNKPCVLDFGAPAWCGWCQKLEPVMREASSKYKDRVDFYTIDTDYYSTAFDKMKALTQAGNGVPLLITVDAKGNWQVIGGYVSLNDMSKFVDAILSTKSAVAVIGADAY